MKKKILFVNYYLDDVVRYPLSIAKGYDADYSSLVFESIEHRNAFRRTKLGDIQVYDVSFFGTFSMKKILRAIAPHLIVMIDDAFFMNSLVIKTARELRIPTLYVQHGIYGDMEWKKLTIDKTLWKLRRYSRYCRYWLHDYPTDFFEIKFWRKALRRFISHESIYPKVPSDLNHCDYAAVWGRYYADVSENTKGYDRRNVFVLGNPDFGGIRDALRAPKQNTLLYIMQPLAESGAISEGLQRAFLGFLESYAKKEGLKLVLKLHRKNDLGLCRDFECVEEIGFNPVEVAGHYSSLLIPFICNGTRVKLYHLAGSEIRERTAEMLEFQGIPVLEYLEGMNDVDYAHSSPSEEQSTSRKGIEYYQEMNKDFYADLSCLIERIVSS